MENINQKVTQPMKKKTKHAWLSVAVVVTILAVAYIGVAIFFQSHFYFGTSVDGIAVGGRSANRVEQMIKEEIDGYTLTLLAREDGKEVIAGSDIQLAPVFQGEVEACLGEQKGFDWIVAIFQKNNIELEKMVAFDEDALDQEVENLACVKSKDQREPVNATYSEYTNGGYELVPADYGTTIEITGLKKAVSDAINSLDAELDMNTTGCYVEPEVGDDNKKLLSFIDTLNSYTGMTITYEFGEEEEVLDGNVINEWLLEEDMKVVVDNEAVAEYVKTLAKEYNTAYRPKTLMTSYDIEVTITNGAYGWKIDNQGEIEQILADLEAGEDVKREPVYSQTANSRGENDYGDSYVEINLTAQHLFLYKDGELVIESDFVSGDVSKGNATPTGAFMVTYTTTDAVLRGEDYATPVKYWMPYAGDVGMHDATWRGSFGGGIYLTNGSHGCVNLPLSVAKTIYNTIEKGYAVLVYTLPGTESDSVKQQEAANVVNIINSIGEVTLQSEPVIASARNLYQALPETARSMVTNYDVLVSAEATLAQLKAQQPAA